MKKILLSLSLFLCGTFASADIIQDQQLYASMNAIKAFAFDNNRSIDSYLIKRAKAVAILMDVRKNGVIVSKSSGKGVFSMKADNGEWSNPIMLRYKGYGLGPQLGFAAGDVIVLFNTSESFNGLFNDKDYISANVAAAIGSAGAKSGSATDVPELTAWAVAPGKINGAYVGASIDVGRISIDRQATYDLYGRMYTYEDILNGSPKETKNLKFFKETLTKYLGDAQYYKDSPTNPKEYKVTPRGRSELK